MLSRLDVFFLLVAYVKTETLRNTSDNNSSGLLEEETIIGTTCQKADDCNKSLSLFCIHGRCNCAAEEYWIMGRCSSRKTINSSCSSSYECSGKLACYKGHCQCLGDSNWNETHCIMVKILGSPCTKTSECGKTLFCIYGSCQCPHGDFWEGTTCRSRKTFNDTCELSNQCGGKLLCYNKRCQCGKEQYWDGSKCEMQKSWKQSCKSSIECVGNLQCEDSICKCAQSEYWNQHRCAPSKTVNATCTSTTECDKSLYCARHICQCASSDFWNGSSCFQKKDELSYCDSPLECRDTLQCTNHSCVCCDNNYWDGLVCRKKRNRNEKCDSADMCQDTLKCFNGNCLCDVLEYWTGAACARNICAVQEHCLNGATCQVHYDTHRCICVNGYLGDKCQLADGKSNDFIVVFHQGYSSPLLKILPAANRRTKAFVFNFYNSENKSVTFTSAVEELDLENNVLMSDGMHNAGIYIHSDVPMSMFGFYFIRSVSEGFFVIPIRFLSTQYIVPSFNPYSTSISYACLFAISPIHDNTVINIHLRIASGSLIFNGIEYSDNKTVVIVLNKYTTFQLSQTSDITGTLISASKPVAVVSGNKRNKITGTPNTQIFVEMVLPVTQLDNIYVIPYLANRFNNTVRIIAVNHTNLTLQQGPQISTHSILSRNNMDFSHTTISYLTASNEVMVTIYPHELPDTHGDSFMMTIYGVNQYLYEYEFVAPSGFDNFISITVSSDFIDGFVLDERILNIPTIFSVSGDNYHYSSFSLPISEGFHHITHRTQQRFGLWVYGNYTNYDAYGYPAGIAFKT